MNRFRLPEWLISLANVAALCRNSGDHPAVGLRAITLDDLWDF
jgi:hypothetical protein